MLIIERQQTLLELLRQRGSADLETLAEAVGVSTSTVRRDLEALERRGLIERTHGGAVYRQPATRTSDQPTQSLKTRMGELVAEKQAIGRYAASLVQPYMTLLLDGGSSIIYAAEQIEARPLQIVTNSLSVANLFADDEQVELLVVGGNLYPRSGVMVGSIATHCLNDLHADLLFFSLAGIYDDAAFNTNLAMAQVEQVMMRQAARSVLLMDSRKFGRKSLVRVCGIHDVDQVVTDAAVRDPWITDLGERLIRVDPQGQPLTRP